ncbi:signal recognition particle receptor subunit beta [Lysobacter enzymogenes]|uniref:GTP-binding protein n=1 Tax=Lysobacter enzymogenes TaxID=69 RepID=UPI0033991AA0
MSELIKLAFVGDMGAGKTTAIRAISDREPISTEMPISHATLGEKTHTTVAMDYSTIELDDGELLHVYGVPGQRYLDFMWPLVCEGAVGIVVLVAADGPDMVNQADAMLREFARIAPDAAFAVGVTRADLSDDFALLEFRDALGHRGHRLPMARLDARDAAQVETLIRMLLSYRYAEAKVNAVA